MNNSFSFNSSIWHNIESLANSTNANEIKIENTVKEKTHESQNIKQLALILKSSIINFQQSLNQPFLVETSLEKKDILKTFNQALKNYKLLGLDKVIPLNQEFQIPGLQIEESLEERKSFAKQALKQAKYGLEKSNDVNIIPSLRAAYTPQMTGAMTANGTYYVYGDKNFDLQPSEINRLFIAKPAMQEAGAAKSPQKHPQMRDGIKGGEGAIRERIVYTGQALLKIDCGIPPTFVTKVKNSFLSSEVDFEKITKCLETIEAVNLNINLEKFIDFMKKGHSLEDIFNLINLQDVSELCALEKSASKIIALKKAESVTVTYAVLMRELRKEYLVPEIQSNAGMLKKHLEKSNALAGLKEAVSTLWNELLLSTDKQEVVSLQYYVAGCQSLGAWLGSHNQNDLPMEEVHKLIIDLIFFNTDRHLNNILVDMASFNPKLVLIDHGSCLPEPLGEDDCKGLKGARYEFLELSHCKQPLHHKYAEIIKNLDIQLYIESLKKDQLHHQSKLGELCHISKECYRLIELNLHLIQTGIEVGATVKQMGSMHQITNHLGNSSGGELIDIYLKYLHKKDTIDWNQVNNEIRNILITKGSE